jgi:hypothetical protein
MRSGKDTVARLLAEYGFLRLAFADRMKELATELFGMPPNEKNRPLLVALGRKMRELDERVWADYLVRQMPTDQRIVVTDLRWPWEVEALRECGFYLARINVTPEAQLLRIAGGPDADPERLWHASETALDEYDDWDFQLDGSAPYADLADQVEAMAAAVLVSEL